MEPSFYTFQDICRINDHHWDNAYAVMLYHVEKGNLEKVVRGPEDIIYLNVNKIDHEQLNFYMIFKMKSGQKKFKRKRINLQKVEIPTGEE